MATAHLTVRCRSLPFEALRDKKYMRRNSRSFSLSLLSKHTGFKTLQLGRYPQTRRSKGVVYAEYKGSGSVTDHGYDVYELLGVEPNAPLPEIKQAYRWLQKRCHPDIAGAVGHDMAILLNDAYTLLSDPMQRATYDVKRIERAAYEGYTGEPLYSKWLGPADEGRAIFVDESQCVGCLKCALIASNTFAIENRYGRARAVGQWGDSEGTIKDAIRACPVDCISFVGREQLPALEFVMTKQPRVIVGVDMYSNGGQRSENVFIASEKFLKKCAEREKSKKSNLEETAAQKEARMAAAENIQARAGRWWHHFIGKNAFPDMAPWDSDSVRASRGAIIPLSWVPENGNTSETAPQFQYRLKTGHDIPEDLGRLFEAAAQRRRLGSNGQKRNEFFEDDYWSPAEPMPSSAPSSNEFATSIPIREKVTSSQESDPKWAWTSEMHMEDLVSGWMKAVLSAAPVVASVAGAVLAGMNTSDVANSSEVINTGGPLPAEITSGVFMQMFLAAAVWYMICAAVSNLFMMLAVSFTIMRRKKD